jgi:hypothetical protein
MSMHHRNKLSTATRFGIRISVVVLAVFTVVTTASGSGGIFYQIGAVQSRSLVLGSHGKPVYVEYDTSGKIASNWLTEAYGEDANDFVMNAGTYRAIVQSFNNFIASNKSGTARGAYVLSAKEYADQAANGGFTANITQADGSVKSVLVPSPNLNPDTKSVLVRSSANIPDPAVLGSKGIVLFEAPIDLKSGQIKQLDDSVKSLLINNSGDVIKQSQYDIGLRAAYYAPAGTDTTNDTNILSKPGQIPLGPVINAQVETGLGLTPVYTDSKGQFSIPVDIPPCPGFSFNYDYTANVRVPYRNFNPQSQYPIGYHYFRSVPTSVLCVGYGEIPITGTLSGEMIQIDAQANSSLTNLTGTSYLHIPVDIALFNGAGMLTNITPDGADEQASASIRVGDSTTYDSSVASLTLLDPTTEHYDFNGDQKPDWVSQPNKNGTVSVLLNQQPAGLDADGNPIDSQGNLIPPDIQRLEDYKPDFKDRGLLTQISAADLKKTDIYLFRVSTGELILKQQGLSDKNISQSNGSFYYQILVPGAQSVDSAARYGKSVEAWQTSLGLADDLKGYRADTLRPGEVVELVAVNRPTGYIGTVKTTVQAPNNGELDFPIDQLALGPPNLKIRVKRAYTVQAGLTTGQKQQYSIGFEGAGLTTDTYIQVLTDWTDRDGTPLPEGIDGYTGRLAKVVEPNTLGENAVATFQIKPGNHLQVVKLQGDVLGTQHFYIHVSGEPTTALADFSTTGAGSGVLAYRPDHYVPVRVPIFDETTTREVQNAAKYAEEGGASPGAVQNIYQWPYRPEMQFSVYDLKINQLTTTATGQTPNDLLNSQVPQISSGDQLNIEYDLMAAMANGQPLDRLPGYGPSQQLLFSLGGYEVKATIGPDGHVTYSDLGFLKDVDVDSVLMLRLLSNNDAANSLWEFGVLFVDLDIDSDNNNGYGPPDRSPQEDAIEATPEGRKLIFVDNADTNGDGIPDYADYTKSHVFVPVVLQVGKVLDTKQISIMLHYAGSDPAKLVAQTLSDGSKNYVIPPGYLRLWKKNGDQTRNPEDAKSGGDYIAPDKPYSPAQLGITNDNRIVTLYLEAVRSDPDESHSSIQVVALPNQ